MGSLTTNEDLERLGAQYQGALHAYLREPGEAYLNRAYEMGRAALRAGHGILQVAALHQNALQSILALEGRDAEKGTARMSSRFLSESLSPFEMSHRATRDAALAMQRFNDNLEAEARRIAHALHNEAGQLLASVHIALADLGSALPAPAAKQISEILGMLREVEDSLRDLSHELRPTVLENLGLLPALDFLAEQVGRRARLAVRVTGGPRVRMAASIESAIYRAVQEGLNNVVKHARASRVDIALRCGRKWVSCSVRDDGIGMALAPRRVEHAGLGLIGIRERLAPLGGVCRVASHGRRGTSLLVVIPLGRPACIAVS